MNIRFDELEKALQSLEKALSQPKNEFTRDATIQRFEYTFELAWKVSKKVLEASGIISTSPRTVIRDMAQQSWILESDLWMHFVENRNLTSHTYSEKTADQVYDTSKLFLVECKNLLIKLKSLKF